MSTNVNEDRKRLKDLLTDASDLERELKKQEHQKRRAKNAEAVAEVEEETDFLRNSLKDVYEEILLIDLKFANDNNIEDKLWRTVFYSYIEELRQKLRKIKPEKVTEHQAAHLELCRYLDLGTGFYHSFVCYLKIRENINLDRVGIEIFNKHNRDGVPVSPPRSSKFRKKELAAECIQRCLIYLGDFARYREESSSEKRWEFARQFYSKAARVYCYNGKAQGQLAVLASYSNNDLDVVYWYSFSLSTQQPSPIAAENLKTFYAKFQTSDVNRTNPVTRPEINELSRKFLSIHRLLYDEEIESLKTKSHEVGELVDSFELLISSQVDNPFNLGTCFKKIIFILIFTLWNYRSKSAQSHIFEIRHAQCTIVNIGFGLCVAFLEHLHAILDNESGNISDFSGCFNIDCLPAVIMWCGFLNSLTEVLGQLYVFAKSNEKDGGPPINQFLTNLTNFVKSLVKLLNHSKVSMLLSGTTGLVDLSRCSVPEDLEFLGVIPLRSMQQNIKFNITGFSDDIFRVRMSRLFLFAKSLAELKPLDMFAFSEITGQFILVDEATKKKERQRIMKIMAQQLLQDQVNSLEQNLQKIGHNPKPVSPPRLNIPTKQCVVDIQVVLHHLKLVRRWTADAKCMVVVPLDVIDSLDLVKKGDKPENARAREAIRFLDQQLDKRHQDGDSPQLLSPQQHYHHTNKGHLYIRAQKVYEKLPQWAKAGDFLISSSEGEDLFNNEETCISNEPKKQIADQCFDVMTVPVQYRPILSCALYYVQVAKLQDVFLVTDDEHLRKYANMFRLPVCTPANV